MDALSLGERLAVGRTAEVFALREHPDRVVKLFLHGFSANAPRELDVTRRLHAMGVAVPAALEAITVDGRTGLVFERVDGPSLLDLLSRRPWTARSIGAQMAVLHAGIHAVSVYGLPSAHDILARRIHSATALRPAQVEQAMRILEALPRGNRVCHGDFHPGNVLHNDGRPVTVDWTDANTGDPLADVARTLLLLRVGAPPETPLWLRVAGRILRASLARAYLSQYSRFHEIDATLLELWLTVVAAARLADRIPSEEESLLAIVRRGVTSD